MRSPRPIVAADVIADELRDVAERYEAIARGDEPPPPRRWLSDDELTRRLAQR